MRKATLILFLMVGLVFGQVYNTTPYTDTCWITDTLDSATVYYGKTFNVADAQPLKYMVCKVNDTAEAGYANDSVQFEWGYERGFLSLDSAADEDTVWERVHIFVDSMCVGNFGAAIISGTVTHDILTPDFTYAGEADTSNVTGFAVQVRPLGNYHYSHFIRPWVKSLGKANKDAAALYLQFHLIQKKYSYTRGR